MYICKHCGSTFKEPHIKALSIRVPYGQAYDTDYEYETFCPECGNDEYEEAEKCSCGEYVLSGEVCETCGEQN